MGGGVEGRRERGREKTKQTPRCQCRGGRGLDPKNCEIMTFLETKSQMLNDWDTQAPLSLHYLTVFCSVFHSTHPWLNSNSWRRSITECCTRRIYFGKSNFPGVSKFQHFFSVSSDKPIVGDEFLAQFLQNYEIEDDIKMLLEMPANGEKEMTGKEDVCQAASRG